MLQAPYNKHIFVFTFKNLYDVDTNWKQQAISNTV